MKRQTSYTVRFWNETKFSDDGKKKCYLTSTLFNEDRATGLNESEVSLFGDINSFTSFSTFVLDLSYSSLISWKRKMKLSSMYNAG